jgi:hypothetical protein
VVPIGFEELNARDFMLVAFKSLIALELLILCQFPQLDGHIPGTACQVIPCIIEMQIVDHASVFSQSLLTFSCLVVPDFDACILRTRGQLGIRWMELDLGDAGSVTHKLPFLRFSRNCIARLLNLIHFTFFVFSEQGASVFLEMLQVDLVLLIGLAELFALPLQIHHLFL